MGGAIAIVLRQPDGTEHRMVRWTNVMPHFITNLKMVQKDSDHIADFIRSWTMMRDDWNENHLSGMFQLPMTECYAPYDGQCMYPIEHGLVVVDLMHDRILSMQGFTSLDSINETSIGLQLLQTETEDEGGDVERLKAFYDAGRVVSLGNTFLNVEIPVPQTFDLLLDIMRERHRPSGKGGLLSFKLDMSPLTIETFKEDPEGSRAMRARVKELGFVLSDRELTDWIASDAGFEE